MPSDSPSLSRSQLALAAIVVAAVLTPLALTATYHCDELNAIRHAALFAEGDFQVPGRPGLLWFALTPLFALPSPPLILMAGRLLSVAATALLAVLWLRLAGREIGRPGAVLGLALLVASPNYMAHAFEIRTDTFVLPLQLLLIGLLCRRSPPRWAGWVTGAGVAAALLISQKSVYFVAGLHGAALVYGLLTQGKPALWPTIRRLFVMDLLGLALVLGYYGLLIGLNEDPGAFLDEHLGAAASTAFDPYPLDRKARGLWHATWEAPALYLAAVAGIVLALRSARRQPLLATLAVLDLALLSTIFIHRGFFHYYVASMEPIHALLAALTLGVLWRARGRPGARGAALNVALALVVTGSLIWGGARWDRFRRVHNGYQEAVMDTVTEAFDGKVQVFDGIGLLPGFPQPGFFMTKGGREAYRDRHPNDGLIRLWTDPPAQVYVYDYMTRSRYLTAVERRYIRDHYAPYRDNVRLLGHRGRVGSKGQDDEGRTVEILVPGPYTAWFHGGWTGHVTVGGATLDHGQTLELEAGELPLVIEDRSGSGELWLLIGRDREPDEDAVDYSMFPILNRKRYQHYTIAGDLATPPDCPSR